ncbi:MAG: cytochrome P450 [Burkholderiaceae bacterium]|nr:cytochrome P450 [Burkholderiales bacterium]MCZ8101798.1 cytochrome P450 [Burkholderiales bacterium]MCZ8339298.1 cytochrome P450 [Burkholderiaceae bacterium]
MTAAAPVYDPTDEAIRRDPYPLFARLRDEDPVHWSPALRTWVVTRYDDVREVAMADALSPNRLTPFYASLKDEARRSMLAEVMRYLSVWLVFRDPPEHTRLRRILNGVVNPRLVAGMKPQVRRVVDQVLDRVHGRDEIDFAAEVAALVPAWVILDMLGIPREHFEEIKGWSDDIRAFIGTSRAEPRRYERVRDGTHAMAAFFRGLIAERRAEPREDVISRMIAATDDEGALSEDELVGTCILMLFGGHETTTSLLTNAVNALLDHPEQAARLRAEPDLIDPAVEEFLRYDGPSNSVARVVARDHEIGGRALRAGERVYAMVAAANRDPRRFERPDELDLARSPNRHLTFGSGIHFCLGAPLARLEAQACIAALLERHPRIARGAGDTEWLDAMVMRGMTRLPLRLA